MTQKNVYKIGKIHQLFDLNNDAINFVCNFRIMGEGPEKVFEYLVLSQSQLDNMDKLPPFNKAKGVGVGQIVADKGLQENYFLAIKSEEDTTVQVETHFEKLPDDYHIPKPEVTEPVAKEPEPESEPGPEIQYDQELAQFDNVENYMSNESNESFISKMFKSKILWLLLIIAVLIGVYFVFFSKNKNDKPFDQTIEPGETASGSGGSGKSKTSKSSPPQAVPTASVTQKQKTGKINIDKLNKLMA